MTSPRRTKKSVSQCTEQNLDWDSPSAATGTVRRRSCPDHRHTTHSQTAIFEVETPSDSGSATSRSIDEDGLIDIEQRISFIINENRSSNSNSESSEVDIIIDSYLNNPLNEDFFEIHHGSLHDRSNTFIIPEEAAANEKCNAASLNEASSDKKNKERKLKAPAPIKKLNKPFDIVKHSSKVKETKKIEDKASVLPVYRSTVQGTDIDLSNSKKRVASKLRMPFSPTRAMDKPKMNFFQNKTNFPEGKPSPLLSSPVRRTISNEYVRLKFTNDTVLRRTIDGKPVPKITPKIQSIIPESPVDSEDPFLNLSPNKKYTVTVNNKVRCDKDNYVIFDPATGFGDAGRSRIPLKSPSADSSRIPLRSLEGETAGPARKSANVSDTDSGILSPNSPVETSERGYYANAAAFSDSAQKCATKLDITIVDPGLAQKAAEQIQIYTDWANHYLERARSRRRVAAGGGGLARDCADGLLLCDVLEGVTGQRVPRAHRKPRTKQQMLENVQGCLEFLHAQHVQGLDQVTAADIRDAKLKAVLALFFALSRHKQATKQRTAPSSGNAANGVKNSAEDASLSSVQRITGGSSCDEVLTSRDSATEMTTLTASRTEVKPRFGIKPSVNLSTAICRQSGGLGTCIPVPGSAAAVRRAPPDRRPLPATPTHGRGVSACSSRSSSPPAALSFIPRPPSSTGSRPNSSLLAPGSKLPGAPSPAPLNGTAAVHTGAGKHSMLDKLKLFNKDKQPVGDKQHKAASNKRTSSSSGFSSAKSERSDSSLSLNEGSHAKASLLGPKARHNDTLAKDKSGKNVKSKLITSKAPKDSTTNLSKASGKTVSSEKSRNSPKLPARDKESKLAAPKSISNTKLNQIDDHSRNQKTKPESKMVKLSGSQLKLSEQRTETTDTGNQDLTLQKAPASQPQLPPSGQFGAPTHTGIPKPTAAVKGTFKVSKDDRHIISKSTNSQLSPIQSNSSLNSTNNVSALPFSREQSNLSKETSVSQKQTLAVSPMPAHTPAMSDSQDSRHSGSTGVGHHSTSSDGSSVIYRPSSESGSDCKPSKRLDMSAAYIDDVINEAEISEKEVAQHRVQNHLQAKSGFDPNRTLTELSGSRSSTPSHCREGSLGEDEHALMSVVPMRPLLRGYSSHLTLPLRAPPYPRHTSTVRAGYTPRSNPDYMDAELAAGYMSDGDCLRLRAGPPPPPPDADGYLSEGGASLYARRHLAPAPPLLDDRGNACAGGGGGRRGMEGGVVYRVVGRSRSKQDSAQQTERHRKYPEPAPTQPPSPGGGGGRRERRDAHRRDKSSAAHQLAVSAQHQYAANLPSQHSSRSGGSQAASPGAGGGRAASAASNGSACGAPGGGAGGAPGGGPGGGKAKVPQSFGYVKRQNGAPHPPHPPHTPPPPQHNGGPHHVTPQPLNGRTAQVSAVPRTKVKVSGGTQTCTQDLQNLQIHKNGIGPKSFSLGGCAAAQLSASVRERLLGSQSLPKPGSHDFAALFHHHRGSGSPRALKVSDGSLSDTQAYAEPAKHEYTPYAPSHRHSNTYSGRAECEPEGGGGGGHRTPLAHNKQPPPRLNRSNSIRSTKSEKLYGVCAREPDYSPYYCLPVHYQHHGGGYGAGASEPPSPGAVCGARGALSPTPPHHTPRHSHYYPKKNDDAHGSSASLVSTASSLAAGAGVEERQQHEVRKLRRELADAKEKVHTLTTQLTTNAHVVSAFEQSLSNMTQRLHQLTATAERKDSELTELRQTIELLRKQSIQAGLTTAHMHSMGIPADLATQEGGGGGRAGGGGGGSMSRHLSTDSVASATSLSSGSSNLDKKLKKKGWLRSSFTKAFSRNAKISKTAKHASFGQLAGEGAGGAGGAHLYDDPSTIREGEREDSLEPEPPAPAPAPPAPAPSEPELNGKEKEESHLVDELKRQLREKELVLTDIRLEALSSAHQLESLKDTVTKMRNEMLNLKQNNERLQRLVTSRSLAGSQSSLAAGEARRYSLAEAGSEPLYEAALPEPLYGNTAAVEGALFAAAARDHAALPPPTARELAIGETYHDLGCGEAGAEGEGEGKRIAIAVFLGPPDSFPRYLEEVQDTLTEAECGLPAPELPAPGAADLPVAYTRVSGKTTWQALDYTVRKALKEYLARVDPGAGLGLSTDCVVSYHLGEATRGPERPLPPLLPCGYIVGTVSTLYVCLDAVGSLAFDSLIPRSIVHRYVSLVSEHRRVILCGPSGTGKSYLAAKLAEYHVQRTTRRGNPAGAVATFNVERKSSSELRAFLSNIAEQSAAAAAGEEAPLPSVLVLDNLAHAAALGDVFAGLPAAHGARMPLIIGTMSQATCDTTNLQLQHDFRWLLTANHLEPVKGFLARYLRRKLVARELAGRREPALRAVVEWLPAVWAALNAFLEAVAASDVTVGPRLFLACPMDARASQAWFADVWNYSVVPYCSEAAREGARLYGRRAARDPTHHVRATWPWPARTHDTALRPILPEGAPDPPPEPDAQDPLLGMLLRLQEAADYGAADRDSDNASLDSNLTHDSSLGADP